MATKKKNTSSIQNALTSVQTKAQDLNKEILIASEELIEGSVATGEQWQDIMAKALKNGTTLFGKQQELALDTVEALVGQYQTGNVRLKKLLGINGLSLKGTAQKAKDIAVQAKDKTAASVDELIGDVFKKKRPVAKKKAKKAAIQTTAAIDALFEEDTTVAKTAKVAKKAKAKATAKVKVAKRKKSTTNARVKKVSATAKKTARISAKKEDFKIIEGIGPKIEELLKKAGILTFEALATTDIKVLKTILAEAGSRYKLHDPTTWGQQAELAAAGKWEVLKVWKSRLKGGKSAKEISRIVVL